MNTASKRLGRIVQNGLLAIYSIFALFPLIWMIILTFKSDAEMYTTTFVFTPTLANYKEVLLHTDYLQYMLDSLIVSGGAVLISVLAGVPAAYALARYNFKKKEDIAFQILSFKFAPEILVVLPLFMLYQKMGIYDSYFGRSVFVSSNMISSSIFCPRFLRQQAVIQRIPEHPRHTLAGCPLPPFPRGIAYDQLLIIYRRLRREDDTLPLYLRLCCLQIPCQPLIVHLSRYAEVNLQHRQSICICHTLPLIPLFLLPPWHLLYRPQRSCRLSALCRRCRLLQIPLRLTGYHRILQSL